MRDLTRLQRRLDHLVAWAKCCEVAAHLDLPPDEVWREATWLANYEQRHGHPSPVLTWCYAFFDQHGRMPEADEIPAEVLAQEEAEEAAYAERQRYRR
jgi:hypothetical protein